MVSVNLLLLWVRRFRSLLAFVGSFSLIALGFGACGTREPLTAHQARVDYDILERMKRAPNVDFESEVRPVLEKRCVVCHGCYDAPCQLKLSSYAGIARGGSKEAVYDGARITAADPTRLFIDALTASQWRQRGFHPVVSEAKRTPSENLDGSLMYRMLRLKQLHPQPLTGMLDPSIDVGLDREQTCPTLGEFEAYAEEHPNQGMPFALPNLAQDEYEVLVRWLAGGARVTPPPRETGEVAAQIESWEQFLNGTTPKERLVARYLFEHLFLGHLHFAGDDPRRFYTLLRSRTPPGTSVLPVNTRRPYGDPGERFYYRLQRGEASVVGKDHLVYELSPERLARLGELFVETPFSVSKLPGYDSPEAANPFKVFADIPVQSRYRFLLDDARFFIEGFIKGPVCRGQIALNVIEDRFWIVFFDPDAPLVGNSEYINQLADYLALPSELGDTMNLLRARRHYLDLENRYLDARHKVFEVREPWPLEKAAKLIWNGAGQNPNAALTVYRHLDSASVDFGLVGSDPETAWVLDYPLLERIHYLLVAGFDVYGNLGHQLNTRLHMDVLRMEAEGYLLAFLPKRSRQAIHASWYEGIREDEADDMLLWWMNVEFVSGYRERNPQAELYSHFKQQLGSLAVSPRERPCRGEFCTSEERVAQVREVDREFKRLEAMSGEMLQFIPDVAFVRVELGGDDANDLAYTLLADKSYKNVSSMFAEEELGDRRDYEHDRQTVLPWLESAYPNFFYVVPAADVARFVRRYDAIASREDYERFVAHFGIRRTNPRFWAISDWFNEQALRERPELAGLFDLNRYGNR